MTEKERTKNDATPPPNKCPVSNRYCEYATTATPEPTSAERARELEAIDTYLDGLEESHPHDSIKRMNDRIRALLSALPDRKE